jgi:putative flippase GtrA
LSLPIKLLRYLVAGGLAAIVDLGGFLVLLSLGMGIVPAAALAFTLAAVVNFSISARYVFSAEATLTRFGAFLGFAVIGLSINTGVTAFSALALGLPPWLAKCSGIGIAFGFNFLVNASIVFRNANQPHRPSV